jgi:hypothetical protein
MRAEVIAGRKAELTLVTASAMSAATAYRLQADRHHSIGLYPPSLRTQAVLPVLRLVRREPALRLEHSSADFGSVSCGTRLILRWHGATSAFVSERIDELAYLSTRSTSPRTKTTLRYCRSSSLSAEKGRFSGSA